ncbi:MAG: aminoglycoside phosphotransferase family protein [Lachnospiraceae bacterium]|nr:aminoglycoside phosphotransferase family protein [Lachnospiraceae bacterium]
MQTSIKEILTRIVKTDWDDETEIETENYSVRLFSPTTISSAFQCFEVHIDKASVDTDEYDVPEVFVVKIGQEKADREGEILEVLYEKGFSVPKVYGRIELRNPRVSINIILEEFIQGHTLFEDGSRENWLHFAGSLADFHKGLWNMDTGVVSPRIGNRVNAASWFANRYRQYIPTCKTALAIVDRCTRTFLHGDLVPTNVMISAGEVKFIDLNDGGTDPYVLDIARAISCVDPVTIERCCPEPEEFCRAYYDVMQDRLGSFEEFRRNVRAAEFLECSALAQGVISIRPTAPLEIKYADYMLARVKEQAERLA